MTYRIEPWVGTISSPIIAVLPDGENRRYENGELAAKAVFDKHYVVKELSATNGAVILHLVESQPQDNHVEGYF